MAVPPPAFEFVGLLLVAALALPFGLIVVRFGEWFVGRTFQFSILERLLLALYASGGVLYLVAAIPAPLYGLPVVAGLLTAGIVAYAVLSAREHGRGLRALPTFVMSVPGIVLCALTLGLLAIELAGVAPLTFGNAMDGSIYSLFVKLTLTQHTLPWTLQPYASVGVIYPQTAPIWMTVPVLLFGWPITSVPLAFPALFLALSVVGVYCLGERLAEGSPAALKAYTPLLFAAFFGLVASWPRLFVGGSYDFVICMPLFFLVLGWLLPFVRAPVRSWREVVAFGVVIGIATGLNAMIGVTLLLLLAGFLLAFRTQGGLSLAQWAARWLTLGALGAISLLRTLIGVAIWFNYPGHVLTPVGRAPIAPPFVTDTLSARSLNGNLNPFVLFKPELSPFPWQSLEIAVLLVAGLALVAAIELRPTARLSRILPPSITRPILVGAVVLFVEVAGLSVAGEINTSASGLQSVVNLGEASLLLFIFYSLIAILPLLTALSILARRHDALNPVRPSTQALGAIPPSRTVARRRGPATVPALLAIAVLLVPLASGAAGTVVEVPSYIDDHIEQLANVSEGDIMALEWVGSHLAGCSKVLVAPDSVGQYLPEYASVGVIFPTFPTPVNLSYHLVVQDLSSGIYVNSTRSDMLELGVTEVFVSGQTSVSFPPFLPRPLEDSSDFSLLFEEGDAYVFGFELGIAASGCAPG
ncbi:MAG: hypothetical protein WB947_07180 [Thermoplasmata archaeon]